MAIAALIRHGAYQQLADTPSALQPFPLTEEGAQEVRQQAQQFGAWLQVQGYQLDPVIHASTLLRAWQTADIYAQELADYFAETPRIRTYSDLCERSVGAVANLPLAEIERLLALDPRFEVPPAGWKSDSDYCLPFDGAESLMQAGARVAKHISAWRDATHDCNAKTIKLFVGHGASIRHAAFHMNVIKLCDIKKLSMYYGHPVVLDFADESVFAPLFGDWKQRQKHDVPD
ncbi:histidine phosphatase family protein [Marinomonas ostreistagni]|uniref:histidine phosphatase family protein n=1 Tax=Marinomonas ostreistagni TaxID=359209 RepID=UPI001951548E|nr:histidine phosphatase family protein [Marinomonas ostreistagni]MBM6549813.1 histidine phosphatase family protein [Marinomonas ostreistagni]